MSKLLDWIKANAAEGANIAEAEQLVQESTFDGITTKEQAIDFIGKTTVFKSATDSLISTAVNSHDEKFKSDKLPGLIEAEREKIRKELNPDETPEQIRIRELEERIAKSDKRDAELAIKQQLRDKAKELGYDPIRAERFSVYGENALETLQQEAEWYTGAIQSGIDTAVKEKLSGRPPKGGNPPPVGERQELINRYNAAEEAGDVAQMIALKGRIAKLSKD